MTRTLVFLAVYNEERHIGALLERFRPVLDKGVVQEVLVVDDGSTDGTPEILSRFPAYRVIRQPGRQGVGNAIRTAYRYALEKGYDVLVVMAGNGKDDPSEIPQVAAPILSGAADYVQGSRFLKGGAYKDLPWMRWVMIHCYTWLWSLLLLRWDLTDVTNGFRSYRLEFLRDPRVQFGQDWLGGYEMEYYVHYKALTLGYKFQEVAVSKNYPSRTNYSKIRPILDWWGIVKPLFILRLGLRS